MATIESRSDPTAPSAWGLTPPAAVKLIMRSIASPSRELHADSASKDCIAKRMSVRNTKREAVLGVGTESPSNSI